VIHVTLLVLFQEYIVRQRSVNIDVDSHGRSCKERMMSILGEEKATGKKRCYLL
jgi:hypothetical protein